jgi:hypothetical protein
LGAARSKAPEKSLACLDEEEQAKSLRDFTVTSHFEGWSFMPCNVHPARAKKFTNMPKKAFSKIHRSEK